MILLVLIAATPLSLAQARSTAAEHAPVVANAAAQLALARKDTDVAGMLADPRIGGGATVNYLAVIDFYMLLPIFGQRETARNAAAALAEVSAANVEATRLDARLAAAVGWIELWQLGKEIDLFREDARRRRVIVDAAQTRYSEGAGSRLDVLRSESESNRAAADLAASGDARTASAARLEALFGSRDPDGSTVALGEPDERIAVPNAAEIEEILHDHPLFVRSRAQERAADLALTREERSRWPRIGVSLSDWIVRATSLHDVRGVLTIDVPLFDTPRISRTEAAREAAHVEIDGTEHQVRANLTAAIAELRRADTRCRVQLESVLPAAREVATLSAEAYAEGMIDLVTAIAAEMARSDAERATLTCRAERGRAVERLTHALGKP